LRSEFAEAAGEDRLTFAQGVGMTTGALAFGAAAGITYASGKLGPTCFGDSARCGTLSSLVGTTYGLVVIAAVGLVVAFGTQLLLDEIK